MLNLIVTKTHNISPYEICIGRKPNLKNLRVWGSSTHILIPSHIRNKLDGRPLRAILLHIVKIQNDINL